MTQSSPNQTPSQSPPEPPAPNERNIAYHLGLVLGLLHARHHTEAGLQVARLGNIYDVIDAVYTKLTAISDRSNRINRRIFLAACAELEKDVSTADDRLALIAGCRAGVDQVDGWLGDELDRFNSEWSGEGP